MKINRKLLPFIIPVTAGIIVGSAVLLIKPSTGKKIGDLIYSQSVSVEGYSYAVNKAAPSVVNIYVSDLNEDYTKPNTDSITSSASGVIMDRSGIVVTNYHVVPSGNEPNKAIWVQTRDGQVVQGFVVGCDRRTDIAVLKIDAHKLVAATPVTREVNVGDIVLAIGNPNNLGQTVTHGIISALARSGTGLLTKDKMTIRQGVQDLIQTDAPINLGNSGGALVDTQGNLIGINTASFSTETTYGIGFTIPVSLVQKVMNEIITHGKVERGYLGISDSENNQLGGNDGITVGFVDPQGPAFGILKIGDVITKVNGQKLTNVKELIEIVTNSKPGVALNFDLIRDGSEIKKSVTLIEDNTSVD